MRSDGEPQTTIIQLLAAEDWRQLTTVLQQSGACLPARYWIAVGDQLNATRQDVLEEHPLLLVFGAKYGAERSPASALPRLKRALALFIDRRDEPGEFLTRLYLLELQSALAGGLQVHLDLPRILVLKGKYFETLSVLDRMTLLTMLAALEIYFSADGAKIDALLGEAEALQRAHPALPDPVVIKIFRAIDHVYNQRGLRSGHALEALNEIPDDALRPLHRSQIYAVQGNWLAMEGRQNQLVMLHQRSLLNIASEILDEGHTGAFLDHWQMDYYAMVGEPEKAISIIDRAATRYAVLVEGDLKRTWHWMAAFVYSEAGRVAESTQHYDAVEGLSPLVTMRYRQQLVMAKTCINLGQHEAARELLSNIITLQNPAYLQLHAVAHGFSYLNEQASGNDDVARGSLEAWVNGICSKESARFITVGYSRDSLLALIQAGREVNTSENYDTAVRTIAQNFLRTSLDDNYEPVATLRISIAQRDAVCGERTIRLTKMQHRMIVVAALAPNQSLETSKVCDALWPQRSGAENRLYAANFRLKKVFADAGMDIDHYVYCSNGRFGLRNVTVDALEFARLWRESELLLEKDRQWAAVNCAAEAISLWNGMPGELIEADPVLGTRLQAVAATYRQAVVSLSTQLEGRTALL